MMRRRMAQMNARMNPGGMAAAMNQSPAPITNQPVPSKGGATSNGPPYNQGMQSNVQQPGKPGMGGQINKNVQDAVKKVISL